MADLDVSVVVPAYNSGATLQRCVDSLLRQDFNGSFEILVCASADTDDSLPSLRSDPDLRILTHVPRLGAAAARNRAAAEANGRAIAFTDADVEVAGDWLERLAAASGGVRCVAGSVVNGTPDSAVGTAEYLLQFIDLHPRRPPAKVHFGATCNLFLPRELWASKGPFTGDLKGGEDTILSTRLRREGRFVFEPRATVTHLNRTSFKQFIRHQYEFGKFSARLARLGPGHAATQLRQRLQRHPALAPLAAAGRLGWVLYRTLTSDRSLVRAVPRSLPMLAAGSGAWGVGLLVEGIRGAPVYQHDQRESRGGRT